MLRIRPPTNKTPIDRYLNIAGRKRRKHIKRALYELESVVAAAFKAYANCTPAVERVAGLTFEPAHALALRDAYESAPTELEELWDEVYASTPHGMCCYCEMDAAESFDHVLPLAANLAFSVCSHNLVPACIRCNGRKSARILTADGRRRMFHAFFEEFPVGRWLYAELVSDDTIRYSLSTSEVPKSAHQQLLREQFEMLGLLDEYQLRFAETGFDAAQAESHEITDLMTARENLARCARGYFKKFGPNYYLAVGFEALSIASDSTLAGALSRQHARQTTNDA